MNSNIKDEESQIYDEEDVLQNIQIMTENRNDNNELIKIHCCDLRNNGILYLLENCNEYVSKMNNELKITFYDDLFTTILECKNSSCYLSNKQKRKIDKKYLYNFDIFQKISNKFINIEFIESLLKKPEIEGDEILKTCYSKVNDNYTILRMLKPYNSKIRIAYLGSMHVCRMVHFFFKLFKNLEVIDFYESEGNNLHKDIIDKILKQEKVDFLNEEYVKSI